MSEKIVPATAEKPASQPGWLSRLSLTQLTLAVLFVVFVWQWLDAHYRLNQLQELVAQRLSAVDGANKANQTLIAQNQEVTRELGGKLSVLENRFAETQAQRAALEALYHGLSGSREQAMLADVEQVLLIAEQQLQLSGNVKAALIALQNAASRLRRSQQSDAADLRRRIERDIERLRALPEVDVRALDRQLDQLIAATEKLPLAQEVRPVPIKEEMPQGAAVQNAWQRFWHELWQGARQLIRIGRTDQAEMPLLSPTQSFFVRENLKLVLLSARLSLLSHDETGFRRELNTVQGWIGRYFDSAANETRFAQQILRKLAVANLAVELPDISATLAAVRNYRAAQERSTP
ncbi:MAG: uroporphyrinogen-III C-methyltransferase [Sideroxydans sp.]|jgi:uroporphyrin-3 C-methyltransferase